MVFRLFLYLGLYLFIDFLFGPEIAFEFDDVLVVVGGLNYGVLGVGGFGGAFDD